MQQREQLILKKLAEAREAQASTLTRFIQARTRVMQVEARLQAIRARQAVSNLLPAELPAADASADNPDSGFASAMPVTSGSVQITSDTPVSQPAWEPVSPIDPLAQEKPAISETPTASLVSDTPLPPDKFEDEEDTKKQPAISLTGPSPARPEIDEEETLILTHAELLGASHRENQEQQIDVQTAQTSEEGNSATDITTKIPVIRREQRPSQELS